MTTGQRSRVVLTGHPIALHIVEKTLPATQAYIGRVRQILMDEAYRRLMVLGRTQGVIRRMEIRGLHLPGLCNAPACVLHNCPDDFLCFS